MSLSNIISATATILGTVTGIGTVHAYERWAADEATFKALFVSSGKVNGWAITREATTAVDHVGGASMDTHDIVIRGYYSLDDSANTEKTFQDLIEAIRSKFNPNRRLTVSGTVNAHTSDRIQVRPIQHRMFGGVLCHYCELVLRASEIVT
jgi:hypothetical protein